LEAGLLDLIEAKPMEDGGMGSLYFPRPDKARDQRRFGKRIAQTEFADEDGVLVSVALNVDQDDQLFELDVWRTDFSPVSGQSH
jgi:hypothetical protein